MPGRNRLIVLGVVTMLVAAIVTLPARVIHHWFSPPAVQLAGIEGTLWSGKAREASVAGMYLRNVAWDLKPLQLFIGRLALDLEGSPPGGFLESSVAIGITGTVRLNDLRAAVPLGTLQGLLGRSDLGGDVAVQLSTLAIVDGRPTEAEGSLSLSELLVRSMAPSPLGNFRAELQSGDDGIIGSVEDAAGMLDLAGTLQLRTDGSYTLSGQVAATAEAPARLRQEISYLGSPDARGLREFRVEGRL